MVQNLCFVVQALQGMLWFPSVWHQRVIFVLYAEAPEPNSVILDLRVPMVLSFGRALGSGPRV